MTKKELSKYYKLSNKIKEIEEKIQVLKESTISGSVLTGMPFGGTISNPVQQRIELIEKYTEELEEKKSEAIQEMMKIETYLSTIEDLEIQSIFNKRYIELKQWNKIAMEMHLSERSVFRKHSEQLKGAKL